MDLLGNVPLAGCIPLLPHSSGARPWLVVLLTLEGRQKVGKRIFWRVAAGGCRCRLHPPPRNDAAAAGAGGAVRRGACAVNFVSTMDSQP